MRRTVSQSNENWKGYKKTRAGWIPEEWGTLRVEETGEILSGRQRSPHYINGSLRPYLRVANILESHIDTSDVLKMRFTDKEFERFKLEKGDILLNEGQSLELVGRCALYKGIPENCCFQNTLIRFRPSGKITSDFSLVLFAHLQKSGVFSKVASRTTSIAHLGAKRFARILISLPPVTEQMRITDILSTWDKAIDLTRKLIDAKMRRKKAIMQQLLTGKTRLSDSKNEWNESRLGKLFKERKETGHTHLPLLAITGACGIIPASDINRKDSSSQDKSRYKRIAPGDIGYNTMRMWQGVSATSDREGIVSPAYTIGIPQNGNNAQFFGYLFKFDPVIHLFLRFSQGLVNDTLNLKFHNFSQIKLAIPEPEEQNRIAEVLSTADKEIQALNKKLSALEKQKRGLMQKLLTGEVRVKTQE